MNRGHGAVVRVVLRVVGNEGLTGAADIEHLADHPEFAETQTARAAFALHLHGAHDLVLVREAMAVGRDDSVQTVVIEFEELAVVNRSTDRLAHGTSHPA